MQPNESINSASSLIVIPGAVNLLPSTATIKKYLSFDPKAKRGCLPFIKPASKGFRISIFPLIIREGEAPIKSFIFSFCLYASHLKDKSLNIFSPK